MCDFHLEFDDSVVEVVLDDFVFLEMQVLADQIYGVLLGALHGGLNSIVGEAFYIVYIEHPSIKPFCLLRIN